MTSLNLSDDTKKTLPEAPGNATGLVPANKYARRLINYFIIYHLLAFTLWNMPPSRLRTASLPYIHKYLHFTCIWQAWGMFATPGLDNIYMSARIKYADGSQKEWYIGRQDNLGKWDAFINERARKMMETAFNKDQARYYPHMANWAAWRNTKDPHNPPVSVEILRYWHPIEKPSAHINQSPIKPVPEWYSEIVYSSPLPASPGGKVNSQPGAPKKSMNPVNAQSSTNRKTSYAAKINNTYIDKFGRFDIEKPKNQYYAP